MTFLLGKLAEGAVRRFLSSQRDLPFSYREVGATKGEPPRGYVVDRYRVKLGEGEEAYKRARDALRAWRQFDLGWVSLHPGGAPLEVGTTVAVLAGRAGFRSLNSARIIYILEEGGSVERFGFAYGTLPGHAERGEERFLVEWSHEDDSVFYDVFAFSRPNHPLAWLGYPFVRLLQKRFARDSKEAMRRAVASRAFG